MSELRDSKSSGRFLASNPRDVMFPFGNSGHGAIDSMLPLPRYFWGIFKGTRAI
jgi:hypothetical protein